jgi:hypothetical protein
LLRLRKLLHACWLSVATCCLRVSGVDKSDGWLEREGVWKPKMMKSMSY